MDQTTTKPQTQAELPTPVRRSSRICFGIVYLDNEADAQRWHDFVRDAGHQYNGGWFDGMPCGREQRFDYHDDELDQQLYAVTTR